MFDESRLRSFDLETYLTQAGHRTPKIVCGSVASFDGGRLLDRAAAIETAREILESYIMVGANIAAFDLVVLAGEDSSLLPLIFRALREGRIFDILIAQTLDSIAGGMVGLDPRTGAPIRNADGKPSSRHSLFSVVDICLGRKDAKDRDAFRTSYALLDGIPISRWPEEARQYPIDDAVNQFEVALAQLRGFERGRFDDFSGPLRNVENLPAQCEAAFCLALGATWGLRTDGNRVEVLAEEVEEKHAKAVEYFKKFGFVRDDGSEDQVAVKRAVAIAYGATGTCNRCSGKGRVGKVKEIPCRGEKVKGRFQGCVAYPPHDACPTCGGRSTITVDAGDTICKASDGGGCDGTGLDLTTAPMLPRTDKGGISASRDSLMESGDDDLSAYGADEFEKVRSTYVPYLRTGANRPLSFRPNAVMATGRCSYDGSPVHQFPREAGYWKDGIYIPSVRECILARPGYVLGSTDYSAGELCALAQYMFWVLGESKMLEAINSSGDPGILHSELGAETMGISLEEFLKRLKAKDKQAKDFRQASKCLNFGGPSGIGSPKIVFTYRKKSAGETVLPDGTKVPGIRFCVLVGGKERCGRKVTEWKGRPCAPICEACCEVVEHILKVAYFNRFPEIREYFRWVSDRLDYADGRMPSLAWDWEKGEPKVVRWRGGVDFSAACNNGFQSMLADIGKLALSTMTREMYLGEKLDGSLSPLAGSRMPIWLHDEPLTEIPEGIAHLAGPRIAEIMVESGKQIAPNVVWKAETALARYWNKGMEPVVVDGKLVPWEPKK